MARIPIIMPKMSMTMTEGEVATWMVKVGDEVNEGDVVAEVMTDKVDMEVESTHTGTLVEITVEEGMVAVGDPIGYLEGTDSGFGDLLGTDEPEPQPESDAREAEPVPDSGGGVDTPAGTDAPADGPPPQPESQPQSQPQSQPEPQPEPQQEQVAAVPRARALARERGLDLAGIAGTGPEGRVTVEDVEGAGPSEQTRSPEQTPGPEAPEQPARAAKRPKRDRSQLVRAAVARKMVESATVPQFTVWRDVELAEADARREGLSWTTVLLRAYAAALRDVPELLCRWEDDTATPSGPPSVALAVATPGGLMVPVFSEPDTADPHDLDAEIKGVVGAVREGRLDPAYLGVANGSLSNLGGLGVDRFQALVTPPQGSVLALGSIKPRPVAVPGGLGVVLSLSAGLTVDHRIADGAQGATLLERFVGHLAGSGGVAS